MTNTEALEIIRKAREKNEIPDLRYAYLRCANLSCANLRGADLRDADLRSADLSHANLINADLSHANLGYANLRGADLSYADLRSADLSGANLSHIDLTDANLTNTCLDPDKHLPELSDEEILEAGLEIDEYQGKQIVRGWRTRKSQHVGTTLYEPNRWYEAPYFSTCEETACHPGIYLASRKWLKREYPSSSIAKCFCYRDELFHAGNKWRALKIYVEG